MAELTAAAQPRVASQRDVDQIVPLINAAFRVEDFFIIGDRTDADEIATIVATPGSAFLVVQGQGDALVGAVRVVIAGAHAHFGMLAIDPGSQGRGLGRALVRAVEEYARTFGCVAVELEVVDLRTELQAFYERTGYSVSGRAPFPVPDKLRRPAELVLMHKRIGP